MQHERSPRSPRSNCITGEAPNNIEAEQAFPARFVNNDLLSPDFLKPVYLYELPHRKIFSRRRYHSHGQDHNPVTIKTFLPSDDKVGDLTVA